LPIGHTCTQRGSSRSVRRWIAPPFPEAFPAFYRDDAATPLDAVNLFKLKQSDLQFAQLALVAVLIL
jgi:hypothetical protein